jgi:outer membrane lipoprotein-sorting protein
VAGSGPGHRRHDRIEVAVDAELGILLRRIETAQGELLTRTELTDLTMNPPEAADPARFAPPPGSNRSDTRTWACRSGSPSRTGIRRRRTP